MGLCICIVHTVHVVAVRHTYDAVVKTSEQNCPCAMRRLRREDNIKLSIYVYIFTSYTTIVKLTKLSATN